MGVPLNNLQEQVQFDSLIKLFGIDTIYGKANFKDIGINFKQEKFSAFNNKNFKQVKNLFAHGAKGSKDLYHLTNQNSIKYDIIDSIDFGINKNKLQLRFNGNH
ncbi:MAG: hypothetical protein MTP17_03205 [Candidatus Midichloria sp.]|nr:MAG: hypothetical protein MTP17_03205 [Candidatus Midichloria sp.]